MTKSDVVIFDDTSARTLEEYLQSYSGVENVHFARFLSSILENRWVVKNVSMLMSVRFFRFVAVNLLKGIRAKNLMHYVESNGIYGACIKLINAKRFRTTIEQLQLATDSAEKFGYNVKQVRFQQSLELIGQIGKRLVVDKDWKILQLGVMAGRFITIRLDHGSFIAYQSQSDRQIHAVLKEIHTRFRKAERPRSTNRSKINEYAA